MRENPMMLVIIYFLKYASVNSILVSHETRNGMERKEIIHDLKLLLVIDLLLLPLLMIAFYHLTHKDKEKFITNLFRFQCMHGAAFIRLKALWHIMTKARRKN